MDTGAYHQRFLRYLCQTSDEPIGLVVEQARGATIYTKDGKEYLDFMSGICVCNVGHAHQEVVDAIKRQSELYLHAMVYGEYVLPVQVELAEQLASILANAYLRAGWESNQLFCHAEQGIGIPLQVYFTNSGTEANEGALKVAKKFTGRKKLIAFDGSFHGDTHGSLSVTGREVYRKPFEPLLPNVTFLPFNELKAINTINEEVAAVIVEPIQGEGGVRVPSDEFLPALRRRCTQVGALLIFDEVQTGFGRTGKLFAFEHWRVVPDIITLAKGLGGGMPLGAFVGQREVMRTLSVHPPLSHVTTFGGHPVSCAAALASLNILLRDDLPQRAAGMGERIRSRLRAMQSSYPAIQDVLGKGLLIGLELSSPEFTRRFVRHALERGLILGWTLHSDTVVRIAPPLTIAEEELEQGLSIMESALRQAQRE